MSSKYGVSIKFNKRYIRLSIYIDQSRIYRCMDESCYLVLSKETQNYSFGISLIQSRVLKLKPFISIEENQKITVR